MPDKFSIIEIDVRAADDSVLAALVDHQNAMLAERFPSDPPRSLEERRSGWQHMPAFIDLRCWVAWSEDGNAIIANAWVEAPLTPENRHLVDCNIMVLPAYRRRGIGQQLLAAIADYAHTHERRLLLGGTTSHVAAGALFMERIEATPGLQSQTNQLEIEQLDIDLIHVWMARATERAQGFELGFWDGPLPTNDLREIAQLMNIMNTVPRGTLDRQDVDVTPEQLSQVNQTLPAQGIIRWTAYVREQATGRLAGFSNVFWQPLKPTILEQGDTGVLTAYRNRGLGRWLKAAMLDKVLRERPEVRFVRTQTADTNAPMLKINAELGFKLYTADTWWQIDLRQVRHYLETQNIGV